ncbi:hypothetical protein RV10_GL003711 [Enterococcus pallens]|nr:hypothetical protein RV10_GL003711 [Enterococcus pallens]
MTLFLLSLCTPESKNPNVSQQHAFRKKTTAFSKQFTHSLQTIHLSYK